MTFYEIKYDKETSYLDDLNRNIQVLLYNIFPIIHKARGNLSCIAGSGNGLMLQHNKQAS